MKNAIKFKISKEIKENVQLKKGEYLIVQSLKGDMLILTKPKEPLLNTKSILGIVGIGKSGLKDVSSRHDDYLYPPKEKSSR